MTNFKSLEVQEELPRELRAVLMIFNADEELMRKALPHVDIKRQSVDWYSISRNPFGGGHSGAIAWAKAIWSDQLPEGVDPFDRAFAMGASLQTAVLAALRERWGLI